MIVLSAKRGRGAKMAQVIKPPLNWAEVVLYVVNGILLLLAVIMIVFSIGSVMLMMSIDFSVFSQEESGPNVMLLYLATVLVFVVLILCGLVSLLFFRKNPYAWIIVHGELISLVVVLVGVSVVLVISGFFVRPLTSLFWLSLFSSAGATTLMVATAYAFRYSPYAQELFERRWMGGKFDYSVMVLWCFLIALIAVRPASVALGFSMNLPASEYSNIAKNSEHAYVIVELVLICGLYFARRVFPFVAGLAGLISVGIMTVTLVALRVVSPDRPEGEISNFKPTIIGCVYAGVFYLSLCALSYYFWRKDRQQAKVPKNPNLPENPSLTDVSPQEG
jgi:hypothetical protein